MQWHPTTARKEGRKGREGKGTEKVTLQGGGPFYSIGLDEDGLNRQPACQLVETVRGKEYAACEYVHAQTQA